MKRQYINIDRPLRAGEVRKGLLSQGQGALVFDETQDMDWLSRGKRSYLLRRFPHGTVRRRQDGSVRISLTVSPSEMAALDYIIFGQELGDISDYVVRYAERRRK